MSNVKGESDVTSTILTTRFCARSEDSSQRKLNVNQSLELSSEQCEKNAEEF